MKKLVLFVSVLTLGFTSCTSDDNATVPNMPDTGGTLEGRWERFQRGSIINDEEILTDYTHEQGCTKDFTEFFTGGTISDYNYFYPSSDDTTCNENISTGTWSRSGNMLTVIIDGESETAEILTLNATTLKVKFIAQVGSGTTTSIQVFKRIAADSNVGSFTGSWEYSREGIVMNGQEVYQNYAHTPGCTKDYIVIANSTITEHYFDNNGPECVESTETITYTRTGNTISTSFDGEIATLQILQLDHFTLKIKSSETVGNETVNYITVFKRI